MTLLVLSVVLLSPVAEAGTFPVLQEQILIGSTTGVAGAQAADGLFETLTEVDVPVNLTTGPSAQTVSVGSQVAGTFPADVAARDGVYAQYRETTPAPGTAVSNPATTLGGCTWTACDSGRLSDNVSASSAVGGDVANYTAFSLGLPASSVILSVDLGYEAFNPAGNDRLSMALSWDGGTTWCPAYTATGLPSTDPNAYTFVNLTACPGHTWTAADFGSNLTTRFIHVVSGAADTIDLDANVVRVTYQPLTYQVSVRYDWSGVPSGAAYALTVVGHISNNNVSVEVLTGPASWTPRLAISGTTDQNLSYTLAPGEVVSGNVSIRFVDARGSSPTPSDLWVDFAEIVTAQHAYRLDVVQNVTGVAGEQPTLTVGGNISAGGENFDVFVWDFATSAWTLALGAPFTAANELHSFPLSSAELLNGSVRVDFRDRDTAGSVSATLSLDVVRVDTTDVSIPPAESNWALIGGVAAAVAAFAAVLLLVLLRRRREATPKPSDAGTGDAPRPAASGASTMPVASTKAHSAEPAVETAVPEAATAPIAAAAIGASVEIPSVDARGLDAGRAYLVLEDEPGTGLRALEALTRLGRSGLVITQRSASEVQRLARPRHTKALVLGEAEGTARGPLTNATRDVILAAVESFLRTNPVGVVLLDEVEGLAGPSGFPALLDVVKQTAETVSSGRQILLASASPGSLTNEDEDRLHGVLELVRVLVPPPPSVSPTRA